MLASEKASGCKLDLELSSASKVIAQRGTISGALPKDGGFYFDGSNDYIQYILGSEFYSDAISFVIEFTPEFNWDEDDIRPVFDSTNEVGTINKRFAIYKTNSGGGCAIVVWCGNVRIAIPPAVYSAYWKLNQKNIIVVSANGTTTTVYLNGIKIANAVVHVWTKIINVNRLHVGTIYTLGFYYFKGLIHSFKIYNRALSDQECLDYTNNATFLYEQRATVILPMRLQDHDPTNLRTLDVSGHGYHATFGDGVTPATYPTKITGKRGYSFDGTSDYLSFPASLNGVFTEAFQNPFTLISFCETPVYSVYNPLCKKGSIADGDAYNVDFWITGGADDYALYSRGTDTIIKTHLSTIIPDYMGIRNKSVYIWNKYNSTIACITLYYNLKNISHGTWNQFTNTFAENNKQLYIGKDHPGASAGYFYKGNMYYFALYPFSLTQIQMTDVYLKLIQDINHE